MMGGHEENFSAYSLENAGTPSSLCMLQMILAVSLLVIPQLTR